MEGEESGNSEEDLHIELSPEEQKIISNLLGIPGISPQIAERLLAAGYNTFMAIAVVSPFELSDCTGMGSATCQKIVIGARRKLNMGFLTGEALSENQRNCTKITTGSEKLDQILGGGIEINAITEVHGEFRTGKTQLAHQLSVTVQLPIDRGGYERSALIFDGDGTFWIDRLMPIIARFDMEEKEVLKRINYIRTYNSSHQMLSIEKAKSIISDNNVGLIVVDGLMSHLRHEYVGRGMTAERQAKLGKILHVLAQYAEAYKLAVFITNQVHAVSGKFFGDPTEPVGGHVIAHCCQNRLYLRKTKGNKRVARLVESPHLPEGEAIFEITDSGIEDV